MFGPFPLYSPQSTFRVHWILPSSRVFAFLKKTKQNKKKTWKSAWSGTHCLIANWQTRPLWFGKCVWDERNASQKTRLKKQVTLGVTLTTCGHSCARVVISAFQCFTDWCVDHEQTSELFCRGKIMQFGKWNRATTTVLCNLSQYLPISRDDVGKKHENLRYQENSLLDS